MSRSGDKFKKEDKKTKKNRRGYNDYDRINRSSVINRRSQRQQGKNQIRLALQEFDENDEIKW